MMMLNTEENYQKKIETKLRKIRMRISTLEKRAGKAEADIEVRYDQKMDQIRGQYAQVKEKLEELGSARQDVWLEQKTELDRAIDILNDAVEAVARQMSV